ncbi:MAG: NAD(P)/FAD-dependent oxidoreductase [Armatimonadetes bacterium]|nr:NAD(P)/FAD-dependent oxidoreductase [Armatimonadota bacterium]
METPENACKSTQAHHRPRVVIVGAGFGGLWAARQLRRAPVDVTLIDQNNYHTFVPLLYQVAAAELEPEAIISPVRSLLRGQKNIRFALGRVMDVDLERRLVRTQTNEFAYDYLVMASGSRSHFFGIPGANEHTYPLKSLKQGVALRNRILCCFENAAQQTDPRRRARLLTFVIVGGGPTGVEFAGALSELVRGPLVRDYPWLNRGDARIVLLEASDRLLSTMPARLGRYAAARLRKMGVEVRLNTPVTRVTPEFVELSGKEQIFTPTAVWTAGVSGDPLSASVQLPIGKGNRVSVRDTLQIDDRPEVFVVGDTAIGQGAAALPMLAPVATQQGVHVARSIARSARGKPVKPFRYFDKGTMATIGRNAAVAHIRWLSFTGLMAWVLWLAVHLYELIGFRNRLIVLVNWAWDYLFVDRPIRLIMSPANGPASSTAKPSYPCESAEVTQPPPEAASAQVPPLEPATGKSDLAEPVGAPGR